LEALYFEAIYLIDPFWHASYNNYAVIILLSKVLVQQPYLLVCAIPDPINCASEV